MEEVFELARLGTERHPCTTRSEEFIRERITTMRRRIGSDGGKCGLEHRVEVVVVRGGPPGVRRGRVPADARSCDGIGDGSRAR